MLDKVGRAVTTRTEMWMWAFDQWPMLEKDAAWGQAPYFDPDRSIAKGLRAMAHGMAPEFGGYDSDVNFFADGLKVLFGELKKRKAFMDGETLKYSAVLISQQTRDFRKPEGLWGTFECAITLHSVNQLLVDAIFDDSLTLERLSQYPVVWLPNVVCLSDAQCEAVRQYVRNGGTLVAMMETSLCDEWGNKRDNFALADLFGVDYVETGGEAPQILVPKTAELKQRFDRFVYFTAPAVSFKLRESGGAEVLMTKSSRSTFNGMSALFDPYDSDTPAVVRNRVGKGTVYYFGADIARGYAKQKLPRVADFVGYLLRSAAMPPLEVTAPATALEVTALQPSGKRVFVHLLNCTAFNFGRMAPLANIEITFNKPGVKSATLGLSGQELNITDGKLTVPTVGYGEVVVLELE